MMQRTQIMLDAEQLRRAKTKAAELGVSLAEYIRRLVERDISGTTPTAFDVDEIVGLGASGSSDVARNKDAYLDDAIAGA
jgi:hypothetical protein